ncbi:S1 RNA-binding domain-containing protein [Sneathiella glossodoripedis]|uniref:S1 RNA-binding domain-containing protein n=1 Tax=Sneathiella glossodoripedis TaxID=418853 RepID=UPI0006877211|nr:S1 RNA-binding domain-containing protein [Sneathiella glossodoripedis]
MVAERQTLDRFTAVFHANQVDKIFEAKVTGVTRAGLFVSLEPTGADALAPISTLGHDFFIYDQDRHTLFGERTGVTFRLADRIMVRLQEVDITTGSMIVTVEDGDENPAYKSRINKKRSQRGSRSAKSPRAPQTAKKSRKKTMPKARKKALLKKKNSKDG